MLLGISTQPSSPTPVSNTGLDCQNFQSLGTNTHLSTHIDWLQGTCRPINLDWLQELVQAVMRALNDQPVWEYEQGSFKGKQWQHRGFSVKGVRWWFDTPAEGCAHLLLSVPGEVCSSVEVRVIRDLSRFLYDVFNFKVTRLDVAIDDFRKRLSFDELMSATIAGNFALVRKITPIFTRSKTNGIDGWTFRCGSRSSDKHCRIYEKELESKGKLRSIRFEAEFHDEVAHDIWSDWLSISDEDFDVLSPSFLSGITVGVVEFVDRSLSPKHIMRMRRLPWWEGFVDAVGAHIRHSLPREITSLDRAMRWVERQVFGTLAILRKVLGIHRYRAWHDEKLAEKDSILNEERRAKIKIWSKEKSSVGQQTTGVAETVDEDGQKWAWVWYSSRLLNEWRMARFFSTDGTEARVRFSGESTQAVPVGYLHLGKDKPTWEPRMVTMW